MSTPSGGARIVYPMAMLCNTKELICQLCMYPSHACPMGRHMLCNTKELIKPGQYAGSVYLLLYQVSMPGQCTRVVTHSPCGPLICNPDPNPNTDSNPHPNPSPNPSPNPNPNANPNPNPNPNPNSNPNPNPNPNPRSVWPLIAMQRIPFR